LVYTPRRNDLFSVSLERIPKVLSRILRLCLFFPLALCFALLLAVAPNAEAAGNAVSIQGFAFHSSAITVPVGSTITWTNQDAAPHTATAKDGSFDTGTLKQGQAMTLTFSKVGTYAYYCQFHPFMNGTVVVTAAPAVQAAAPATTTQVTPTTTAQKAAATVATQAFTAARSTSAYAASIVQTTQAATSQAPMPSQMPSTGAGGAASPWSMTILAGLLILALGGLVMLRSHRVR
jgi:plastocyanin